MRLLSRRLGDKTSFVDLAYCRKGVGDANTDAGWAGRCSGDRRCAWRSCCSPPQGHGSGEARVIWPPPQCSARPQGEDLPRLTPRREGDIRVALFDRGVHPLRAVRVMVAHHQGAVDMPASSCGTVRTPRTTSWRSTSSWNRSGKWRRCASGCDAAVPEASLLPANSSQDLLGAEHRALTC